MHNKATQHPAGLLLAGAMLGGIAAALLTPKDGRKMRAELKDKAQRAKSKITDKTSEMTGTGEEMPIDPMPDIPSIRENDSVTP